MRRNKIRQMQLGIVALAFSCLALLWLVLAIGFWQFANAASVITPAPTAQQTLPQSCSQYLHKYSNNLWDPETETYPRNDAWMDCMGVGLR